jgi:hypothetical protein
MGSCPQGQPPVGYPGGREVSDGTPPKRDELAVAEALYQDQCTEANSVLYASVKTAKTSDELEAAYATHTAARNAALKTYTEARRRILGH